MPGSGKTTHAKQVERNLRAVRFCPDEWMEALGISLWHEEARTRIEKLQWRLARDLLSLGHNVVIEWGTWARAERDALRAGARALGAAVELHFLDAPVEVLFERSSARKMEEPPITLEQIKRWSEMFERPSSEELALFDETAKVASPGPDEFSQDEEALGWDAEGWEPAEEAGSRQP